jgi:hypothetical protein
MLANKRSVQDFRALASMPIKSPPKRLAPPEAITLEHFSGSALYPRLW